MRALCIRPGLQAGVQGKAEACSRPTGVQPLWSPQATTVASNYSFVIPPMWQHSMDFFPKTKYLRKAIANMKYIVYLLTPLTKPTFPFLELGLWGKIAYLCILMLFQEPWFIPKPWRFHYAKQILEIFFKRIICLLFCWMMLYILCVCVCFSLIAYHPHYLFLLVYFHMYSKRLSAWVKSIFIFKGAVFFQN